MMWFLIGQISTQKVLESGGRSNDVSSDPLREGFLAAVSANYNVPISDICVFKLDDSDPQSTRIVRGDSYVPIWSTTGITGLDFSVENTKRVITLYATDSTGANSLVFMANGTDYLNITISAMLPDESAIDTSYNQTILLPMITPSGKQASVKLVLVNGICVKQFKTTEYGIWRIQGRTDIPGSNARIKDTSMYQINALLAV